MNSARSHSTLRFGAAAIERMSREDCLTLLTKTTTVGRIAFRSSMGQQLLPVNFAVNGDRVYIATAAENVLSELADGQDDVAFEWDASVLREALETQCGARHDVHRTLCVVEPEPKQGVAIRHRLGFTAGGPVDVAAHGVGAASKSPMIDQQLPVILSSERDVRFAGPPKNRLDL